MRHQAMRKEPFLPAPRGGRRAGRLLAGQAAVQKVNSRAPKMTEETA